jgi:hypothetical protein
LWPTVELLEADGRIWLRATGLEDTQWEQCRHLSDADRYTVLEDGQLIAVDSVVPLGRLPDGAWQPIARFIEAELPVAHWPGKSPAPLPVGLIRSNEPREVNWLVVRLDAWTRYAVTAPHVRLARLSFAATRDGRAIVRGQPLPPLQGERFVEVEGIAVPAGWTWQPAVEPAVLGDVFGLSPGDSVLWTSDSEYHKICADDWVQATRSAVRLTQQEVANAG